MFRSDKNYAWLYPYYFTISMPVVKTFEVDKQLSWLVFAPSHDPFPLCQSNSFLYSCITTNPTISKFCTLAAIVLYRFYVKMNEMLSHIGWALDPYFANKMGSYYQSELKIGGRPNFGPKIGKTKTIIYVNT